MVQVFRTLLARYAGSRVGILRSIGRFVVFAIMSFGTFTCLARAQPSTPETKRHEIDVTQGLVDPWRDERATEVESEPARAIDPWRANVLADPVIIDPWRTVPRPSRRLELVELVDPWLEEAPPASSR